MRVALIFLFLLLVFGWVGEMDFEDEMRASHAKRAAKIENLEQ